MGTLVLELATFFTTPWDCSISIADDFHIGVWSGFAGDTLGRLVLFSDTESGPYHGSVIALRGADGELSPPLDRQVKWGDAYGIYYRYFRWSDGRSLWTLMVSLWYPLLLFAALPVVWVARRRQTPE